MYFYQQSCSLFQSAFSTQVMSPSEISLSIYKPSENPLQRCISPRLISSSLQYLFFQTLKYFDFGISGGETIDQNTLTKKNMVRKETYSILWSLYLFSRLHL